MLDVDSKKPPKPTRAFRIDDTTWNLLHELAEVYNATPARVIEAMVQQYGAKILADKKKDTK